MSNVQAFKLRSHHRLYSTSIYLSARGSAVRRRLAPPGTFGREIMDAHIQHLTDVLGLESLAAIDEALHADSHDLTDPRPRSPARGCPGWVSRAKSMRRLRQLPGELILFTIGTPRDGGHPGYQL
jgi:hypothetical protein